MTKNDTPANIRLNKRQRNKYLGVKSEVCGCVFDVLYVLIQRLKINKEKLNLSEFSGRYDMKANCCRINRAEPFLSYGVK